jgi:hypothetical protein
MRSTAVNPVLQAQSYKTSQGITKLPKATVGSWRLPAVFLLLICTVVSGTLAAADAESSAPAMKAAYLHRFASYVEWPGDAEASRPFVIAVAGDEEVATHLEKLLPGMTVRDRPAVLRRVSRVQELEGVSILYVGPNALRRTRALRSAALSLPILIVTDNEHGFEAGAVINFIEVDRNVRFEISLVAADRGGLKIDSALLSVAERVELRP